MRLILLYVLLAGGCADRNADRVDSQTVAVAANFAPVLEQLSRQYTADTGAVIRTVVGSTGKLYAQISNGAPVDIFLAADTERPRRLEDAGLIVPDSRFTYARGRLVLWSRQPDLIDPDGTVLNDPALHRLAIANPTIAPYGRAAMEVLAARGIDLTQRRLVRGENVGQARHFAYTDNVDAAFIAQSLLTADDASAGSWWLVPTSMHEPIEQQAVLLKRAAGNVAAQQFFDFLASDAARQIILASGYAND
ncbi:MAG: molybdate ABC transporter substrate-binding protein [Lentisphaeria bacterium]|nr:molybdate ABC transporter substrate-binding protein [Lentisphaeria bacterium]